MPTSLSEKDQDRASWLTNAGADDTKRGLESMTGTAQDIAVLEHAIATEKASDTPRSSRLKPMEAKLRKFATSATPIEVEVVKDELSSTPHLDLGTRHSHEAGLHNQYHHAAQTAAAQAAHFAVLCGLELQQIRRELAQKGGRPKNSGNTVPEFSPSPETGWEQWVKDNCDFSPRTARNYIRVAEGVKGKTLKTCRSDAAIALLDIAPSALPEADRQTLLKTVSKVTEGETLRQLYLDFGIIKGNGRDAKKKAAKATHNKGRPSKRNLALEEVTEIASGILRSLAEFISNGHHQILDKADLAHLDDQLDVARTTFKPFLKSQ